MAGRILSQTRFRSPAPGWSTPAGDDPALSFTGEGLLLSPARGKGAGGAGGATLGGPGVHTRNGDSIEVHFRILDKAKGTLRFGFSGGMEAAVAELDFARRRVTLSTSDWRRPQPVASAPLKISRKREHVLRIDKADAAATRGRLVANADLQVLVDGKLALAANDLDVLPEIGVTLGCRGTGVLVRRFVHRGRPSGVPERLRVGGWQVLNRPSIEDNLASLGRGLAEAAAAGVELLVTPETCLTGLFPRARVTKDPKAVKSAERKLLRMVARQRNAPHLVYGLPVWRAVPEHRLKLTRYNVSRVTDPDGKIIHTGPKIHSCEPEFWHGYGLNEFEVKGAPVSMHICHDGRYPPVWTLPVMFGARLVIHPANGGTIGGSVDAFEARAKGSTTTSHAFYLHVNGGGGSFIAGPQKYDNVLAASAECARSSRSFPAVSKPAECLLHADLRIRDAFGYWPVRSFRASEETARAYVDLYRSLGGRRAPNTPKA